MMHRERLSLFLGFALALSTATATGVGGVTATTVMDPLQRRLLPSLSKDQDQYYFDAEMRIVDRVSVYMNTAVDTIRFLSNYRYGGGFPYGLTAPDRDRFLVLANSLSVPNVYVGMEDGLGIGLFQDGVGKRAYAIYREPGNAGYAPGGGGDDALSRLYLRTCVDRRNGTPVDCILQPGQYYVQDTLPGGPAEEGGATGRRGQRGRKLVPCNDEASQKDCTAAADPAGQETCERDKKYCAQYTIQQVPTKKKTNPKQQQQQQQQQQQLLGYIPSTKMCIDPLGHVTQTPNTAVVEYVPGNVDLQSSVQVQGQRVVPMDGIGGESGGTGGTPSTYPARGYPPLPQWSSSSSSFHVLGNCTYGDGATPVRRGANATAAVPGPDGDGGYAYCRRPSGGGTTTTAGTTTTTASDADCIRRLFVGGFQSNNFDPRYRPWYIDSKQLQHVTWTDPYPFHFDMGLGITATHPLYNEEVVVVEPEEEEEEDGDNKTTTKTKTEKTRRVFAGVVAVDYKFDDIRTFLVTNYGHKDTDTIVGIYEEEEPNYVIALSTGTPGEQMILIDDDDDGDENRKDHTDEEKDEKENNHTGTSGSSRSGRKFTPCPITSGTADGVPCQPQRIPMGKITPQNTHDTILQRAYEANKEAGYPNKIVTIRGPDDETETPSSDIYLTHSTLYEQPMANLRWRVVVARYSGVTSDDSVTYGDPLFGGLIAVGVMGSLICLAFAVAFYRKRQHRAIIFADWRFTCYFILACSLLNCSTLALLGPNINPLCMLRMWSFHGFFVVALSPLFVKIWRLQQLLGTTQQQRFRRRQITNTQAAFRTLPMITIQMIILLVISLVDPPKKTDITQIGSGVVSNYVVCSHKTPALVITEGIYEGGLVVIGCILAFQTRNQEHSESKALIFAMYNIALAGVVFFILLYVQDLTPSASYLLQGLGVWWGTVFSSAAFVIPHIIQVRRESKSSKFGHISVSGLNLDHLAPEQLGSNSTPGIDNNTLVPSPLSSEGRNC